jgi:hypothetical protein
MDLTENWKESFGLTAAAAGSGFRLGAGGDEQGGSGIAGWGCWPGVVGGRETRSRAGAGVGAERSRQPGCVVLQEAGHQFVAVTCADKAPVGYGKFKSGHCTLRAPSRSALLRVVPKVRGRALNLSQAAGQAMYRTRQMMLDGGATFIDPNTSTGSSTRWEPP